MRLMLAGLEAAGVSADSTFALADIYNAPAS
jgi:hypothetical protein